MELKELLNRLPDLPQRQDSEQEQLRYLWAIANKLGLYDAADSIKLIAGIK